MKTITKRLELDVALFNKIPNNPLTNKPTSTLLIDIETTGFSSAYQIIYLIGVIFFREDHLVFKQWFVEKEDDEYEMLYEVAKFLAHYDHVVHYNGTNFDMPYIKARMALYHIKNTIDQVNQHDIYISLKSIKQYLPLENLKLKTVEAFFNVIRKDQFTGGELISHYKNYQQSPNPAILSDLLLHNEEDVLSLFACLRSYDLINYFYRLRNLSDISIKNIVTNTTYMIVDVEMKAEFELKVTLTNCQLYINHHILSITIPIVTDELKLFFEDYENYYYLTREDYAVHKSIGRLVDSKYRKRAKRSNCYTKKRGSFIPLSNKGTLDIPLFYKFYQTNPAYIELNDHFLSGSGQLYTYILNILRNL